MIQAVIVTNFKGESLRMELANPEKTGLLIYNIEGIGGASATINSTDSGSGDGAKFNSSRIGTRNIVLYLAMMNLPGQTIEDSRHLAYKYFPTKKEVALTFETDSRTSTITGYVESNDPVIFSSEEHTQISILCPDPFFYSELPHAQSFSGVSPLFEFPFSDDSVETEIPTLEFGDIYDNEFVNLVYNGDADSGVVISIKATENADTISLGNIYTREHMTIDLSKIETITGVPFGKGDEIRISTMRNNKTIYLIRDGIYYTNIISALDKNSDWFQVTNGNNVFAYSADGKEDNLKVKFEYKSAYMGV